jgi:hypothetical protein
MPFGLLAIRIFLWLVTLLAVIGVLTVLQKGGKVVIDSASISPSSTPASQACLEKKSQTPEDLAEVNRLSQLDLEKLCQVTYWQNSSRSSTMEP